MPPTIPASLLTTPVLDQVASILHAREQMHEIRETMLDESLILLDFIAENLGADAKLLTQTLGLYSFEPSPLMLSYIEDLRRGIEVLDGRTLRVMLKHNFVSVDFNTGEYTPTAYGILVMRLMLAQSSLVYHQWVVKDMVEVAGTHAAGCYALLAWVQDPLSTNRFTEANAILRVPGLDYLSNNTSDFISGRWLVKRANTWLVETQFVDRRTIEKANQRWALLRLLAPYLPAPVLVQNYKG